MVKINGQRVNTVVLFDNKNLNQLVVNISVDPFKESNIEVRVTTKDIMPYLLEKNIFVGKCIKSSVISNMNENSLFGEWVFQLPFLPLPSFAEDLEIAIMADKVIAQEESLEKLEKEKISKKKKKD